MPYATDLICYILFLEAVMSIIHELELENKDNVDANQKNVRKKTKQNKTPTAGMMVS